MEKIDKLDRNILRIVMNNARIPSKDVAKECGVSRAAVHQRIQRMIECGIITGSGYNANPKHIGFNITAYMGVNLAEGCRYKEVARQLDSIPEVTECHFTTGRYAMLLKLFARDKAHLLELINEQIHKINGVTTTETLISLDNTINRILPVVAFD